MDFYPCPRCGKPCLTSDGMCQNCGADLGRD